MTTYTNTPNTQTRSNTSSSNASSRTAYNRPTSDSRESGPDKVRPVHEIRLGTIKAAIWANMTQRNTVMYTVTLQRSYRTGGLWKRSETFRRDDLLTVAKVLDLAHSWIFREQQQTRRPRADAE